MPTDEEIREMDLAAAQQRLTEQYQQLDELRKNPQVEGHAAESYIMEAMDLLAGGVEKVSKRRSARVDLDDIFQD